MALYSTCWKCWQNIMYIPFHKSLGPKPSAIQTEMDQLFQSPLSHDGWCRILLKYHHPMGMTDKHNNHILTDSYKTNTRESTDSNDYLKYEYDNWLTGISNVPVVQYRSHFFIYRTVHTTQLPNSLKPLYPWSNKTTTQKDLTFTFLHSHVFI